MLLFRNIILPTLVFLGYLSARTPWAFGGTAELTCSEQAVVSWANSARVEALTWGAVSIWGGLLGL